MYQPAGCDPCTASRKGSSFRRQLPVRRTLNAQKSTLYVNYYSTVAGYVNSFLRIRIAPSGKKKSRPSVKNPEGLPNYALFTAYYIGNF